jgi:hypothetical protein
MAFLLRFSSRRCASQIYEGTQVEIGPLVVRQYRAPRYLRLEVKPLHVMHLRGLVPIQAVLREHAQEARNSGCQGYRGHVTVREPGRSASGVCKAQVSWYDVLPSAMMLSRCCLVVTKALQPSCSQQIASREEKSGARLRAVVRHHDREGGRHIRDGNIAKCHGMLYV